MNTEERQNAITRRMSMFNREHIEDKLDETEDFPTWADWGEDI